MCFCFFMSRPWLSDAARLWRNVARGFALRGNVLRYSIFHLWLQDQLIQGPSLWMKSFQRPVFHVQCFTLNLHTFLLCHPRADRLTPREGTERASLLYRSWKCLATFQNVKLILREASYNGIPRCRKKKWYECQHIKLFSIWVTKIRL